MLQLLVNVIIAVVIFIPLAYVFPVMRGVFIAWITLRVTLYLVDPRLGVISRFLTWRFKGRSYEKQLVNFVHLAENSLTPRITMENTVVCGDSGFPTAAFFVATVARFCGATEWKRVRVPSNYFGDGLFEAQLLRMLNCEPLDFYETLGSHEIAFMARSDLRSHPGITKELKKSPGTPYMAIECRSLPATGFFKLLYIMDPIDDSIFDWQSVQLVAGLFHLFEIYMINEKPLEFRQLVQQNK